jgi:hypothetical protein
VVVGAGKMMMHLFKVEFAIMMLQGICLKVKFVDPNSEEADQVGERSEGPSPGTGLPAAQGRLGGAGGGGGPPPGVRMVSQLVLGFHLYKYLCKSQEIIISIINLLRSVTTRK